MSNHGTIGHEGRTEFSVTSTGVTDTDSVDIDLVPGLGMRGPFLLVGARDALVPRLQLLVGIQTFLKSNSGTESSNSGFPVHFSAGIERGKTATPFGYRNSSKIEDVQIM